jgi:KUP system potassium uptake protein
MEERARALPDFLRDLSGSGVARVAGTAIYLSPNPAVPHTLQLQAARMHLIANNVVLLRVVIDHAPQAEEARRFEIEKLDQGFIRIVVHFGYMENPAVVPMLERAIREAGLDIPLSDATYFVGRETFLAGIGGRMKPLPEALFALLSRNAKSASHHYALPPEQVVELGTVIDL